MQLLRSLSRAIAYPVRLAFCMVRDRLHARKYRSSQDDDYALPADIQAILDKARGMLPEGNPKSER